MTPAVLYCTMRCRFCWRVQSGDLELRWKETEMPQWDEPEEVIKGCIDAQLKILSGYKGNQKTNMEKYRKALTPKHAAISLAGEPTLYPPPPPLGNLIKGFHRRGFTTFLVSNGTVPEPLSRLSEEPTQFYVYLCGFDRKSLKVLVMLVLLCLVISFFMTPEMRVLFAAITTINVVIRRAVARRLSFPC